MTAFSWLDLNGGIWSDAARWTPSGGPPSTSADTATISQNGGSAITLDVSETIGALTLGTAPGTNNNFLIIGSNAVLTVTNAGGQAGTVAVNGGNIAIRGGTLSATGGFSVTTGGFINVNSPWVAP